jgi:hypothetical protein
VLSYALSHSAGTSPLLRPPHHSLLSRAVKMVDGAEVRVEDDLQKQTCVLLIVHRDAFPPIPRPRDADADATNPSSSPASDPADPESTFELTPALVSSAPAPSHASGSPAQSAKGGVGVADQLVAGLSTVGTAMESNLGSSEEEMRSLLESDDELEVVVGAGAGAGAGQPKRPREVRAPAAAAARSRPEVSDGSASPQPKKQRGAD